MIAKQNDDETCFVEESGAYTRSFTYALEDENKESKQELF